MLIEKIQQFQVEKLLLSFQDLNVWLDGVLHIHINRRSTKLLQFIICERVLPKTYGIRQNAELSSLDHHVVAMHTTHLSG